MHVLRIEDLDDVSGGARIGAGEGWADWGRRQLPGDWRTEEQKGNDFKAWDDWGRANGNYGAFGEEPRLRGNETFLNPRPIAQDNLFGPTREELQGLRDLRDGPPDGSAHPTPWAVEPLDRFINEAEQNRDSLGIDSFGRPGYDPDAGLPPSNERRVDAPNEGSTSTYASNEPSEGVETAYADTESSYAENAYAESSYGEESYGSELA